MYSQMQQLRDVVKSEAWNLSQLILVKLSVIKQSFNDSVNIDTGTRNRTRLIDSTLVFLINISKQLPRDYSVSTLINPKLGFYQACGRLLSSWSTNWRFESSKVYNPFNVSLIRKLTYPWFNFCKTLRINSSNVQVILELTYTELPGRLI